MDRFDELLDLLLPVANLVWSSCSLLVLVGEAGAPSQSRTEIPSLLIYINLEFDDLKN